MMGYLRPLEEQDLKTVLAWRNHVDVNQYMFNQHKISEQEHLAWFQANAENPSLSLLVYIEENEPLGFIQLRRLAKNGDVYEWGFYRAPMAEKGVGSRMAKQALKYAFQDLNAIKIYGEVLESNFPSIQFHQKFNFMQEGRLRKQAFLSGKSIDVFCFGLLKDEWLTRQSSCLIKNEI